MIYIYTNKNASLARRTKEVARNTEYLSKLTKTKADISRYPNKLRDSTATADNQKQTWHY